GSERTQERKCARDLKRKPEPPPPQRETPIVNRRIDVCSPKVFSNLTQTWRPCQIFLGNASEYRCGRPRGRSVTGGFWKGHSLIVPYRTIEKTRQTDCCCRKEYDK